MALDYTLVGISLIVFIFYVITFFFLIEIKNRLTKEAGTAFTYLILALAILVVRRLQQIFVTSNIVTSIPYFADFVTLIFAIVFFLAIFHFHKSIDSLLEGPEEDIDVYLKEGIRKGFSVKLLKQKLLEAEFSEKEIDKEIDRLIR